METSACTVTVIVPVYNAERYIRRISEALVNQDFFHYEILFVNDGSTDGTLEILSDVCRENEKQLITVISIENAGVSNARNVGVQNAKGQFITFVDSDDLVTPDYLTNLYDPFKNNVRGDLISMVNTTYVDGITIDVQERKSASCMDFESALRLMLERTRVIDVDVWGKMFPKSLLKKNLFTPNIIFEDLDIWPRLLKSSQIKDIYISGTYSYIHIEREGPLMHSNASMIDGTVIDVINQGMNIVVEEFPTLLTAYTERTISALSGVLEKKHGENFYWRNEVFEHLCKYATFSNFINSNSVKTKLLILLASFKNLAFYNYILARAKRY